MKRLTILLLTLFVGVSFAGFGIGPNPPAYELDVEGDARIQDSLKIGVVPDDPAPDSALTIINGVIHKAAFPSGGGDAHSLDAVDGNPVDVVYVDEVGDVGIGITSPTAKLDVRGSAMFKSGAGGPGAIVLSEGFEGTSFPPAGWTTTNLVGSGTWDQSNIEYHTGSKSAFFYQMDMDPCRAELVTYSLDLSSYNTANLFIWHKQELGFGLDSLRVYYCTSAVGRWVFLANYNTDIPDWIEEVIPLPDLSGDYWIRFVGYSNWNGGVFLDDVTVKGYGTGSPTGNEVEIAEGNIDAGGIVTAAKANVSLLRLIPSITPIAPQAGDIYFDSGTNKLRAYNGSSWHDLW